MLLYIAPNGLTGTAGQKISFSDPQVEIGTSATAYQQTVGFDGLMINTGTGAQLWPVLSEFLPQSAAGTQATGETAVTLSDSTQLVLTSLGGAHNGAVPGFNFGCSGNGCEQFPSGFRATHMFHAAGMVMVECTNVTSPGTISATLETQSVATGNAWSSYILTGGYTNDGMSQSVQNVPVATGTQYFYLPVLADSNGDPPNQDYGWYDIGVLASGGAITTCQARATNLVITVTPTDSTVAGSATPLRYGDRSHLIH